jgi:hypothetical protein
MVTNLVYCIFYFLWAIGIVNIIYYNIIISYKFPKFNIKLFSAEWKINSLSWIIFPSPRKINIYL